MSKVLFVDDEPNILEGYTRQLRREFTMETANSGREALEKLNKNGPYAVIIADMRMPIMNGVELLRMCQGRWPNMTRIMLTGNADQQTAINAVNEGRIFRFLNKPCDSAILAKAISGGIEQNRLLIAEAELLEKTLTGSIRVLSDIMAAARPHEFGKAARMRRLVKELLPTIGTDSAWILELAAMLANIGEVTIPPEVLEKARGVEPLNPTEKAMMERVPEVSATFLSRIPRLEAVAEIVRYQQKNFDGSGFPADDRAGESIPLGARVLKAVRDLVDLEDIGTPPNVGMRVMRARKAQYDPQILDALGEICNRMADETAARSSMVQPTIKIDNGPNPAPSSPPPAEQRAAIDYGKASDVDSLQTGDILASDVLTYSGSLLLSSGSVLTEVSIEKLRNYDRTKGIKHPIRIVPRFQNAA